MSRFNQYLEAADTIDDEAAGKVLKYLNKSLKDYGTLIEYVNDNVMSPKHRDDVVMAIQDFADHINVDLDMNTAEYIADVTVLNELEDVEV